MVVFFKHLKKVWFLSGEQCCRYRTVFGTILVIIMFSDHFLPPLLSLSFNKNAFHLTKVPSHGEEMTFGKIFIIIVFLNLKGKIKPLCKFMTYLDISISFVLFLFLPLVDN